MDKYDLKKMKYFQDNFYVTQGVPEGSFKKEMCSPRNLKAKKFYIKKF